jgi:serine/threonine protein kinase
MTEKELPTIIAGRYQLLEKIQTGETAVIWKAFDQDAQQHVALKFPFPSQRKSARARITQEARAYRYLGPITGLVRFLRYEDEEGASFGPFFVLEFLKGHTLLNYLSQHSISERETIRLGRTLCKTLNQLHSKKVIHRDISLNNIFLLDGKIEKICLLDLGLALIPSPDGKSYESHDSGRVGTDSTQAPEVSHRYSGDTRSDIYSLGRVLHLMISGPENNQGQEMNQFLHPEVIPSASKELSEIIKCCGKQDPKNRYQTVEELGAALAAIHTKKVKAQMARAGALLMALVTSVLFISFIVDYRLPKIETKIPASPSSFLAEKLQLPPTEAPKMTQQEVPTPPAEEPAPKTLESLLPKKAAKPQPSAPTPNSVVPQKSLMEEEDSGLKDLPITNAFKHVPPATPTEIHIRTKLSEK